MRLLSSDRSPVRGFVDGLATGLSVIEAFDDTHAELTLSEVARRAGLTPSTARRSLHTLESLGYVRQVDRRFMLAARILTLGSTYLRSAHVDDALVPELCRLVDIFQDASSISVLDGPNILYVAHYSAQRAVRPLAGIGVTYPAFATSMGRVLLAGLDETGLNTYFEQATFAKLTDLTETDPDRLRLVIDDVRRVRYATAVDQLAYGVTSLAVPIVVHGQTVAAINTSAYSMRVSPQELIETRLQEVRLSADRVATTLLRYPTLLHSFRSTPRVHRVDKTAG